jgi:riboflavin synthase
MFTGIVSANGRIRAINTGEVCQLSVEMPYPAQSLDLGASISHAGVCLTVVEKTDADTSEQAAKGGSFVTVEVSPETLRLTTLSQYQVGDRINLERALCLGEELGGHLVTGHVDGIGQVLDRRDEGEWLVFEIRPPDALNRYIAKKGSITVDGVSLTVNEVTQNTFQLMIIPHTATVTTLGQLQVGATVNLEVDLMARYAARLGQFAEAMA